MIAMLSDVAVASRTATFRCPSCSAASPTPTTPRSCPARSARPEPGTCCSPAAPPRRPRPSTGASSPGSCPPTRCSPRARSRWRTAAAHARAQLRGEAGSSASTTASTTGWRWKQSIAGGEMAEGYQSLQGAAGSVVGARGRCAPGSGRSARRGPHGGRPPRRGADLHGGVPVPAGSVPRLRRERDPQHIAATGWQRTLDDGVRRAVVAGCLRRQGLRPQRAAHLPRGGTAVGRAATPYLGGHGQPAVIAHGTPDQQERYLARPARANSSGASSSASPMRAATWRPPPPGRGSTGGWLITGQKIWTSGAHYSDRAILLARTDPDSHKHEGITYFLADMTSPGIEVRPIVQINRGRHFNEVYLDDVFVPDDDVLGHPGGGLAGRPRTRQRAGADCRHPRRRPRAGPHRPRPAGGRLGEPALRAPRRPSSGRVLGLQRAGAGGHPHQPGRSVPRPA